MKLNYETCIVGKRCVLVPYRPQHVKKYHEWMQDTQILEATGSEPLTLQQEYEMQQSWRMDETKCTFIILACHLLLSIPKIPNDINEHDNDNDDNDAASFIINNLQAMVGDVNLFLSKQEEEDGDEASEEQEIKGSNSVGDKTSSSSSRIQAELDIMIAEPSCRKMGVGREAVCLMMLYGIRHLNISRYFCKINQDNTASRSMFGSGSDGDDSSSSSLGFVQCGYAECFGQYEYELKCEHVNELEALVTTLLGTTELHTFSCPLETTTMTAEENTL